MTSRLSMLVLALATSLALGCGDDPKPKIGFMQECIATSSSSCSGGAAGEDAMGCELEDDCEEGLSCRSVGLKVVCTKGCTGDAECDGVAPSGYLGICNATSCTVACSLNADCSPLGLVCQNATHCSP